MKERTTYNGHPAILCGKVGDGPRVRLVYEPDPGITIGVWVGDGGHALGDGHTGPVLRMWLDEMGVRLDAHDRAYLMASPEEPPF